MQVLKEADINIIGEKITLIGAGGAPVAIIIQADLEVLRKEIDISILLTNATGVGMKPLEGEF